MRKNLRYRYKTCERVLLQNGFTQRIIKEEKEFSKGYSIFIKIVQFFIIKRKQGIVNC